ncbi:hypothetical protein PHIM7_259 [Sinorhizobium phage phiM7]|uniref:Uncharacterized protein n=3 Tax=Emdodecavirus TaxID=1980937 RepID=S5MQ78_9CAUD|nr:hypothetical protein AB690_gp251 [Sinorhizobium phage phiM12]YP_009212504.1 hypothetical protein AVT40_gp269 [Sinorhizobium phage phiN3]YP_009601384.1 hypothetical protein FDH46_gp219 [Sinorhizobium phage phiM7]AKF13164.1 hypothetical protein PHIM19_259 [Sinorhizobium phage phiM19]AGR47975.1 hypothetical protein SmphiM12_343 [Sinorhizobium phage phiM12]AKF12804.1 hypothetical protein PHIM7_259 [Sinorhizobium phage phiM7]AKF13527.1 hypothetical protein PHIN3_264 [Sinorhizobium phage phiN3]
MLPEDEHELFQDWTGSTWNRIIVRNGKGDEIMTVRTMTEEFRERIEKVHGSVTLSYVGGSMDGTTN